MTKTAAINPAVRKVAALLASVDRATAERLLAQLPKDKAREALAAARELGDLSERERRETIAEFRRQTTRPNAGAKAASNGDGEVELSISAEARRKSETINPPSAFRFLEEATDEELVACIRSETPQIAAMALARLSPARGGRLLQALDEAARNAAMERFASLDDSDAELTREAETEIAAHLRTKLSEMRRKDERLGRLRQIMEAAGLDRDGARPANGSSTTVVAARVAMPPKDQEPRFDETPSKLHTPDVEEGARISSRETAPPEEVARQFSRLFLLPPGAIALLCDRTPLPQLLAAMAGAEPHDVEAFARMLPRGESRAFLAQLRARLPISLAEIDRAQAELLSVAEDLADEGLI